MENFWFTLVVTIVVLGFMALIGSMVYRDSIRDDQEMALRGKCIASGGMVISVNERQHHCISKAARGESQ